MDQVRDGDIGLYHTKHYQGTTTRPDRWSDRKSLYHTKNYQGTTTGRRCAAARRAIIPCQELSGNYNRPSPMGIGHTNYTIPRTIRELQPAAHRGRDRSYYTIPRAIREVQRKPFFFMNTCFPKVICLGKSICVGVKIPRSSGIAPSKSSSKAFFCSSDCGSAWFR